MPDESPKAPREPRPSPINGPAFFVFGVMFVVFGLGSEMKLLLVPGIVGVSVGLLGIVLERRYEKAAGIEETPPGKSPERPDRETP